jgi:hypothetical protein
VSTLPSTARGFGEPRRDWLGWLMAAAAILAIGWMLGHQIMEPNKRVIGVLAAVVVLGFAWRMSMVMGIGVLIVTVLFPRHTVFGSTSLAFILILLVIWLLRMSQRLAAPPQRTPADVPLVGLLIAYVVSFYNVETKNLAPALGNFELIVGGLMLFYLIVNNVRTAQDLRRVHVIQCVALAAGLGLSLWELYHPGTVFIRGWLDFSMGGDVRETHGLELHDVRIGGPFFDYELFCEYCALSLLLLVFLLAQARSATRKTLLGVLLLATAFCMFATVTRGGFVALACGVIYLLWHIRRRLKIVPMTILTGAAVLFFFGMNYYVSHYTQSADLLARLEGTKFVGWIPESRAQTWPDAWERLLMHPIIGHGPFYAYEINLRTFFWPHCLYLYIGNLVGLVGLGLFLWFLAVLWFISRPTTDRVDDPSYAQGFLLIANVQLITFMVDEIKIEFLRNPIYQFQPWILFGTIVAAHQILRRERAAGLRLV